MARWNEEAELGHDAPGWNEKHTRRMLEEIAARRAYANSINGLRDRLFALTNRYSSDITAADQIEIDALCAEIDRYEQAQAAKFAAEWTRDVTVARRAEWNTLVKSGAFSTRGKIDYNKTRQFEEKSGWGMDHLKKAIKLHGLK